MTKVNRTNGYGDFRTTTQADQEAFDLCPPPIRHALNYAVGSYAAVPVLQAVRRGVSAHHIIRAFRRGDADETRTTYGRSHPEAGGFR